MVVLDRISGERSSVAVAVEVSLEKESNGTGVGVILTSSSESEEEEEEEERRKKREQLINRLPLNVSVCILSISPSSFSSITTRSRRGTNKREMGISSSDVKVHSFSDIQREVE